MIQLLIHLLGDYLLQSDWMALNKTKAWRPCLIHVILYTIPFMLLTMSPRAIAFIFVTHYLIDRYSLPKYLIWVKNFLNPRFRYHPWTRCNITGYFDADYIDLIPAHPNVPNPKPRDPDLRPRFITLWLYIITDNGIHLACNALALGVLAH